MTLGSHPQTCGVGGYVSHPGPTVNIAFRDDDNEPFGFETVVNHDFSGTGFSKWHWFTGSNWDWRTRIDIAEEGDLSTSATPSARPVLCHCRRPWPRR